MASSPLHSEEPAVPPAYKIEFYQPHLRDEGIGWIWWILGLDAMLWALIGGSLWAFAT